MIHQRIPILLLILLHVFIIIASSSTFTEAQTDVNYCSGCISVSRLENGNYIDADCTTQAGDFKGTKAKLLIIRSQNMFDFVIGTLLSTATRTVWKIDASDAAVEGTWKTSLGEILYENNAVYKFAWMGWGTSEPNDSGNEDMAVLYKVGLSYVLNDIKPEHFVRSTSGVICMYEHPVIDSLKVSSGDANSNRQLYEGTEFTRWRIFPEHVSQSSAFQKCEAMYATDPSTGESVRGYLSVFYHKHEWDVVQGMVATKSDVKYHSSTADFGIWLGGYSSSTAQTYLYQRGTSTTETIQLVDAAGTCANQLYCNKGESPSPNSGLAFGLTGAFTANTMIWTVKSGSAMPYVCSWRFSPNASVSIKNTLIKNLSAASNEAGRKVDSVTLFTVRVHQTWLEPAEAMQTCWNSKVTNEAGDTIRGMLGMFRENHEWNALQTLMTASKYLAPSNGVTNQYLNGWMTGLSGNTNWGSSIANLKPHLQWNRGGKLSVDATGGQDEFLSSYSLDAYRSDGSCPSSTDCKTLTKLDDDSNEVFLTYRSDNQEMDTFNYARRRPFVCTYRFPARIRLYYNEIAEYQSIPSASYTMRVEYCKRRSIINEDGVRIYGKHISVHAEQGSRILKNVLAPWLTSDTIVAGPVYLGPRRGSDGKCLWYRRAAQTYEWVSCNGDHEFMCYFHTTTATKTHTLTRTNTSTATATATRSATSTKSSTSTQTLTSSETISSTFSHSLTSTATRSASESVSLTETSSLTRSFSKSLSDPSLTESLSEPSLSRPTHSNDARRTETFSRTDPTDSQSNPSITHESPSFDSGTISESQPSESRSEPSPATDSITHEPTATYNESFSNTGSVSGTFPSPSLSDPTATDTIHIVPKYKLPVGIKRLQEVTGLATILSGGGTVAVTKARLDAVDVLSRCGQAESLEDEEPDFMSAPMGWHFGDPPTSYAKGTSVGNVVAACIGAGIITFCAILFGLVFKGSWKQGLDIARIPGILMIPFLILVPSSSEAAGVLLFHADDPVATLIAVGSSCMMVGITLAITVQVGRLVSSGLLIMRTLPPTPPSKIQLKLEASHVGRKFSDVCGYLFTTKIGWVPYVDVTEYLDVVAGKEDPDKKRQSEKASAFSKEYGAIFEDFDKPYYAALDAGVSIVLGGCAGVASGPGLPKRTCVIVLSTALITAFYHFFFLMWYRPCLVRATQIFMSIGSGLTLGSVALSFAFYMGKEFAYQNVTEKVLLTQALVGVLLMIVGVGWTLMVFIDFFDAVIAGRDLRHMEKTTQEQLAMYHNVKDKVNENKKKEEAKPKKTALEEELEVLVTAMRPENENRNVEMSKNNNNKNRDAKSIENSPSETNVRHMNHDDDDYYDDDDDDLVNQYLYYSPKSSSGAKSKNDIRREYEERKKIQRLRQQKTREEDDASAKAMIEYTKRKLEEEEAAQRKREAEEKRSAHMKKRQQQQENGDTSSSLAPKIVVGTSNSKVPLFYNKAVTANQSQRLRDILEQADEKKRKETEERNLEILRQEEDRIKKEQEMIERRKRLEERMRDLEPAEQQAGGEDDDEELVSLDEDEEREYLAEVGDILGRL